MTARLDEDLPALAFGDAIEDVRSAHARRFDLQGSGGDFAEMLPGEAISGR
jgi:hypothetical protein